MASSIWSITISTSNFVHFLPPLLSSLPLETNWLSSETRSWLAIVQGLLERIGLSHFFFDSVYSVRTKVSLRLQYFMRFQKSDYHSLMFFAVILPNRSILLNQISVTSYWATLPCLQILISRILVRRSAWHHWVPYVQYVDV